jgi:SAM-dependent methyltransferase
VEPAYLSVYAEAVDSRIPNYRAACWECARSQGRRFEIFAGLVSLAGKRVLDAGCSRGDFARYLLDEAIDFARFVGIDAIPEVIAEANRRALPRSEFYAGDLLLEPSLLATGKPDVICISGTLNTMTEEQAFSVLDAAWLAAEEALLFNFLSDRAGPVAPAQTDSIRRLPTIRLLEWAFERTTQVAFRQDYFDHGHDATIRMLKA